MRSQHDALMHYFARERDEDPQPTPNPPRRAGGSRLRLASLAAPETHARFGHDSPPARRRAGVRMSGSAVGLIVAACVFAGGVVGTLARSRPAARPHVQEDPGGQDAWDGNAVGARSPGAWAPDCDRKELVPHQGHDIRSFATDIISLDETLRQNGDGALAARRALRDYATTLLNEVWAEGPASPYLVRSPKALTFLERAQEEVRALNVANDDQRRLVDKAFFASTTLLRQRWLLLEEGAQACA